MQNLQEDRNKEHSCDEWVEDRGQELPSPKRCLRGKRKLCFLKCHYCRELKEKGHFQVCANYPQCKYVFCRVCLLARFGSKECKVRENEKWVCVICRGICKCKRCKNRIMNEMIKLDLPQDLSQDSKRSPSSHIREPQSITASTEYFPETEKSKSKKCKKSITKTSPSASLMNLNAHSKMGTSRPKDSQPEIHLTPEVSLCFKATGYLPGLKEGLNVKKVQVLDELQKGVSHNPNQRNNLLAPNFSSLESNLNQPEPNRLCNPKKCIHLSPEQYMTLLCSIQRNIELTSFIKNKTMFYFNQQVLYFSGNPDLQFPQSHQCFL